MTKWFPLWAVKRLLLVGELSFGLLALFSGHDFQIVLLVLMFSMKALVETIDAS
jgi:hypothetical protein